MSASSAPAADAVVVLHGELDRLDPLEVLRVERCPGTRLHLRGDAGDAGDRVDRVPEEIAVVDAGATAELPHRVAQPGVDQRVDHDRRPAARLLDGDVEILDVLDALMPDLDKRLIRELRLEREDEPGSGLPRRVGDDVKLDGRALGLLGHGLRLYRAREYQ